MKRIEIQRSDVKMLWCDYGQFYMMFINKTIQKAFLYDNKEFVWREDFTVSCDCTSTPTIVFI